MKYSIKEPISVSDYISLVNEVLKKIKIRVSGEVSQFKIHAASGHVYFTLKDKSGEGIINCVIWKYIYRMCGVKIEEGMEVVVSGNSDIYAPRGSLVFKVETIELVGEGALKDAYNKLKIKLDKEGLFSLERKRKVLDYPRKIGLITSLHGGTVIHDFMNNLGKFGFIVSAIHSKVEGQEAVKELILSVKEFRNRDIDALVIIRGGGSMESLMAFNNEMLVREISNFPVPVIAGIGHHEDVTLVSLAADVSQSTPSAVASFLNKSWEFALKKIELIEHRIIDSFYNSIKQQEKKIIKNTDLISGKINLIFKNYRDSEIKFIREFNRINYETSKLRNNINNNKNSIFLVFNSMLKGRKIEIDNFNKTISQNNPKRQLGLGYSIPRINGKIIKTIKGLDNKNLIELELIDGTIDSEIKKIKQKNE
jgi:exodeoxyribonuclease VII large subunit